MHTFHAKHLTHRAAAAALSLVLTLGGLPLQAIAEQQGAQPDAQAVATDDAGSATGSSGGKTTAVVCPWQMNLEKWNERIDEMLAKGDYVEGEVIVTATDDLGMSKSTEADGIYGTTIIQMTGKDYEQATGTVLPERVLVEASERINGGSGIVTSEDVDITIQLVHSSKASTKTLLQIATENMTVLDITPNYVMDAPEGDEADGSGDKEPAEQLDLDGEDDGTYGVAAEDEDEAEAATEDEDGAATEDEVASLSLDAAATDTFAPSAPSDTTKSADLTSLQWAYNKGVQGFKGLLAKDAGIDLGGWNTGRQNSEGVIAVFDSGVDYTHPDLAGSFFDMTPYLSQTGGTSHGFDALVKGTNAATNTNEPEDKTGHGTHVAGIIAAQANGFGVSGYANGAKLLAVRVADGSSNVTKAAFLAGLAYVERAVKAGVDIRVINNSWELYNYTDDPQIAAAIQRMGSAYGITFVFASGNKGTNIDTLKPAIADLTPKEYVVTVDSSDLAGACSAFSSYGASRTDLFAPGTTIMSTLFTANAKSRRVFMPTASNSYGFESYTGASSRGVYTVKGKALTASVDSASGFDSTGGCLSLPSDSVKAASVNDATSAKTRVVLYVPVDENNLDAMSMVGCSVNLTGYPSCNAWLEVFASYRTQSFWAGDTYSRQTVVDGDWAALSLDLSRIYTSNKYAVKLFHDERGQAYIKVAVCLNKSAYEGFNKLTVGLKIDSVGVGNTSCSYGFMSGTSMAAPLVSGLASSYAYQMGDAYSSLSKSVRAQKLVNVVKKSVTLKSALSGLCSAGGAIDPTKFSAAVSADKKTVYIASASTDQVGDSDCEVTIKGSGFGETAGTAALSSGSAAENAEVVSWSDSEIKLKVARVPGYNVVTASITTAGSETASSKPISVLDTKASDSKTDDGEGADKGDGGTGAGAGKTDDSASASGKKTQVEATASQAKANAAAAKSAAGGVPKTGDPSTHRISAAALMGGLALVFFAIKARGRGNDAVS